mmetsp:Transcript_1466/g.1945  ORF Transcript_1466/g.1945 Transcript_1466/m.1945 type:complete len:360 (-) Transcript_1466:1793-2872(-)
MLEMQRVDQEKVIMEITMMLINCLQRVLESNSLHQKTFFFADGYAGQLLQRSKAKSSDTETTGSCDLDDHVVRENTIKTFRNIGIGIGKKVLIQMVGLPGAGKTTCAKALCTLLGNENCVRASQDVLRKRSSVEMLLNESLNLKNDMKVKCAIVDRTNASEDQRFIWNQIAKKHGALKMCIFLDAKFEVCASRCTKRKNHEGGRFPTEKNEIAQVIRRIEDTFVNPRRDEGFEHIVHVKDSESLNDTFAQIVSSLRSQLQQGITVESNTSSNENGARSPNRGNGENSHVRNEQGERKLKFAFSSVSTGEFKFDPKKAAAILVDTVERWVGIKEKNNRVKVEVTLMEPIGKFFGPILHVG